MFEKTNGFRMWLLRAKYKSKWSFYWLHHSLFLLLLLPESMCSGFELESDFPFSIWNMCTTFRHFRWCLETGKNYFSIDLFAQSEFVDLKPHKSDRLLFNFIETFGNWSWNVVAMHSLNRGWIIIANRISISIVLLWKSIFSSEMWDTVSGYDICVPYANIIT